jgi:hypothetical protein
MSDGQVEYLQFEDPRLGRHIRHDPRSRAFAARGTGSAPVDDVRHRRFGPKLWQRNVGACTCFAGAHAVNTMPVRARRRPKRTLRDADAFRLYSAATRLDPFAGEYPPNDTGSSGLAACLAMRDEGIITGFEHAFGHAHGLEVISLFALMQGTWWTHDMFHPDADGRVHPTGGDAGGHEYLWTGVEIVSRTQPSKNRDWYFNSWNDPDDEWGLRGYFYMTWGDAEPLLARAGDLIRPVIA